MRMRKAGAPAWEVQMDGQQALEARQRAIFLFDSGFYCAESVLLAMAEGLGVTSEFVPQVASGFCSGLARSGGQCGALSGAVIGLGLVHGRRDPSQDLEPIYARVRSLLAGFRARFGATACLDLTGCDLGTTEGQRDFEQRRVIEKCRDCVGEAARRAMDLLAEKK